jgi:hypothetical protein
LDDPTRRLVLTDPETIEARSDPCDPSSAPARETSSDSARDVARAAKYLAGAMPS